MENADSPKAESSSGNSTTKPTDYRDYLLIFIPLALIIALYFPTLQDIYRICMENEDYSHGLILPFISLYLIVVRREELIAKLGRISALGNGFSWTGVFFLVLGGITYLLGTVSQLMFVNWVSFFLSAIGALQLALGTRGATPFLPAVLLLFMAKPLPDSLVPKLFWPLQVFAAKIGASTLRLLDVPVHLTGNIIEIPGMRLMVEEACSGIRSLLALLTVALIVILLIPMSNLGRVLVVIVSVITAIALNVARVTATGVLAFFYDKDAATGFFHTFSGFVVFVVGLTIVYSVSAWASRRFTSAKRSAEPNKIKTSSPEVSSKE